MLAGHMKLFNRKRAYELLCHIKRFENGKGLFTRAFSWFQDFAMVMIIFKLFNIKFNYWLFIPTAIVAAVVFYFAGRWYELRGPMDLEAEYGNLHNPLMRFIRRKL